MTPASQPVLAITVNGACGRMGREVIAAAAADSSVRIVSLWEADGHPELALGARLTRQWEGQAGDVIIDFSSRDGLLALLDGHDGRPVRLVSGTTGLSDKDMKRLAAFGRRHPVLHSANMSTGVAIMHELVSIAARLAGSDWEPEMVETHHSRKVDAPSGTALALARTLMDAWDGELTPVHGRKGLRGPRARGEFGILAVRCGDVVGEHELILAGRGELLRIRHQALSREVFAAGALRAARWLAGQGRGFYTMQDALGLPRAHR